MPKDPIGRGRDGRRRSGSRRPGFVATGPGFHVWEENHSETLQSAAALAEAISRRQAEQLSRNQGAEGSKPVAQSDADAREEGSGDRAE